MKNVTLHIIDVLLMPFIFLSGAWLRIIRYFGFKSFPLTKNIFYRIGIFPIVDHYYEPQFNFRNEKGKFTNPRLLSSINFNLESQLSFLNHFNYQSELAKYLQIQPNNKQSYYFNNGSFNSGDAEFYYSIIRYLKPKRIIEIGSGFSTLIGLEASNMNINEGYNKTEIICIEPYEMPWLENLNITLIRQKVEDTQIGLFKSLNEGDILFIDSSHIIKPNGDVIHEILSILPDLNKGVYIHFHDIFTPYNYPYEWVEGENRLWNEQYILEAFLSYNDSFEIVAMLHHLFRNHCQTLADKFPGVKQYPDKAPGSLWIRKLSKT